MPNKKIEFSNHVTIFITILLLVILIGSGVFGSIPNYEPDFHFWQSWKNIPSSQRLNGFKNQALEQLNYENKFAKWADSFDKNLDLLRYNIERWHHQLF